MSIALKNHAPRNLCFPHFLGGGILMGLKASECHVLILARARFILLHQLILSSLVSAEIMCLKKNNTPNWFIKIMNYLNAISQSIIYKYSKTWFITNMQGCYVPFWDRVQGPSELGKLATFWDIGENCIPFKWGAKLIFSFKFTAFLKNCVLSLKGQKSRWIF